MRRERQKSSLEVIHKEIKDDVSQEVKSTTVLDNRRTLYKD